MIAMWKKVLSSKYGIEVKRIRLDNSGENRSLQKECDKQNLGVIFEFTAPGTPQQNSVVKRGEQSYVDSSRIEPTGKGEFWCEVISTATKLDNYHGEDR